MPDPKVLLLAATEDIHAKTVAQHLSEFGARVDFFRFENLTKSQINYSVGRKVTSCSIIGKSNDLDDLRSYKSIWYRRPGRVQSASFSQPWITNMVESEAKSAIDGMLQSLPCLWVNWPINDSAACQKLVQLEQAQKLGFQIPKSLVTNDPNVVRDFFDECNKQVIYKMLTETSNVFVPLYEIPQGIPTLPLRETDLKHLDQVKHAPHFFQQRIEKECDFRVTVIGRKVFAVRIDSQSGAGKLDWRHDYNVPMVACELPDKVAARCLALTKQLGLNYGAIDLCLDTDGQYCFFEINPAGQYFWLEARTEHKLSLELAKLLIGESEPMVAPTCV